MYGLKLYMTLEDLNDYIHNNISEMYKDRTFIPIKAEINENNLSIDITLLSAEPITSKVRYKLDLNKLSKEE